jgi:succinate dehydrogenase/fumarate reductase cytochrome b subunit
MGTTAFFTILHRISGISVTRALRLHLLLIEVSLVTPPSASSSYLPLQVSSSEFITLFVKLSPPADFPLRSNMQKK